MSLRTIIELLLLAAVWGASFMFMRIATPEFGAVALVEIRVLIAGAVLLPIWYVRESAHGWSQVRQDWRRLFFLGLINSAIPFSLFAYSTLYITGGLSSILNSTVPIWGAVVAFVWLQQRLSLQAGFGLLLGFCGVVILLSDPADASIPDAMLSSYQGVLAALAGAFFYGIAANFAAVKLHRVSALATATFTLLAAAIILLPVAIYTFPEQPVSLRAWLSVLAMAVFSTALANIFYFRLLHTVGATRAMTVAYLIPLFATLWGAALIDEPVTLSMAFGGCVILFGTALVTGVIKLQRKVEVQAD